MSRQAFPVREHMAELFTRVHPNGPMVRQSAGQHLFRAAAAHAIRRHVQLHHICHGLPCAAAAHAMSCHVQLQHMPWAAMFSCSRALCCSNKEEDILWFFPGQDKIVLISEGARGYLPLALITQLGSGAWRPWGTDPADCQTSLRDKEGTFIPSFWEQPILLFSCNVELEFSGCVKYIIIHGKNFGISHESNRLNSQAYFKIDAFNI